MKKNCGLGLFDGKADFGHAIIEMTREVILLLDTEGRIIDCNENMENLSGYASEHLVGRILRDILLPVDGADFPKGYFRASIYQHKKPRTGVYRLLTQSGTPRYLEFNFRVTKDARGDFSGILAVGYDVTEMVEHELSLKKERFALMERNKEMTCLLQIYNLAMDDTVSVDKLMQWITMLIPPAMRFADMAAARIHLDEKIYDSKGFEPSEVKIREPISIENQSRGYLIVAYRNERGRREGRAKPRDDAMRFLASEKHLVQAVARHIALILEKREANERKLELEQQLRHSDRLATIGKLAAGVAHELNEPLGNILGFAQLAGKNDGLPDQLYNDLAKIVKASLHAREIIKKLMLFGRQMPRQEIKVSLNKVVEDGLFFLEARCAKNGITVNKMIEPQLPDVIADPSQLEQVLVNLVLNAVQAMAQGGQLTLRTYSNQRRAFLSVTDTGPGIAEEILDRIFEPFFTTKDVNEGTGLGLSVVHGIIAAHNGSIDVDTETGRGTTFTIGIPLPQS